MRVPGGREREAGPWPGATRGTVARGFMTACAIVMGFVPFGAAMAQGFPNHAIRIINPYAAGGPSELVTRVVASGLATELGQPVLIEAMAYREGHHSTSDDSTRYREADEVRAWREAANPVRRLRRYMERAGWWDDAAEAALVARERSAVLAAMQAAERKPRPQLRQLVTDVYKDVPPHIEEQYVELQRHMAKYPAEYPQ